MRRELELAEGDAFYLVLDDRGSKLTLMYKGAPLRETSIESAEIGEPRARHGGDDEPIDLYAIWSAGALHPPRINVREEVIPPPIAGTQTPQPEAAGAAGGAGRVSRRRSAGGRRDARAGGGRGRDPEDAGGALPGAVSYEIRFAEGLTVEVARSQTALGRPDATRAPRARRSRATIPAPYPTPPSPSLWERFTAGRAPRDAGASRGRACSPAHRHRLARRRSPVPVAAPRRQAADSSSARRVGFSIASAVTTASTDRTPPTANALVAPP